MSFIVQDSKTLPENIFRSIFKGYLPILISGSETKSIFRIIFSLFILIFIGLTIFYQPIVTYLKFTLRYEILNLKECNF